jgi:hypothetical protein
MAAFLTAPMFRSVGVWCLDNIKESLGISQSSQTVAAYRTVEL